MMGTCMRSDSTEGRELLSRAAAGDQEAWGRLLARHRDRLRRMVALRLDQRLQGRVDASDVIQESFLDASAGLAGYMQNPVLPFYLWLRFLTGVRLAKVHRHHLGTQMRDAAREVSLFRGSLPHTSSAALAAHLMGRESRPSEAAMRAELKLRLQDVLNSMEPLDREILALRHFEQLATAETAQVLGIKEAAARKRHIRALEKLREILVNLPGGVGEFLS
jgi:RNA polymerase sigma-70 factor, ECF subfamily